MKILNNMLVIVILCTSNSMFTLSDKRAKKTTPKPLPKKPTKQPVRGRGKVPAPTPTPTPTTAIKTFQQLVNEVKSATDAWDNNLKQLRTNFTDRIYKAALDANLEDDQLDALLQLARDKHAIFTNNPEEDKNILNELAQKRKTLVAFFKIDKENKKEEEPIQIESQEEGTWGQ